MESFRQALTLPEGTIRIPIQLKAIANTSGAMLGLAEIYEVSIQGGSLIVSTGDVVSSTLIVGGGAALTNAILGTALRAAVTASLLALGVGSAPVIAAIGVAATIGGVVTYVYGTLVGDYIHSAWAGIFGTNDVTFSLIGVDGTPICGILYKDHSPEFKDGTTRLLASIPVGELHHGMTIRSNGHMSGDVTYSVVKGASPVDVLVRDLGISANEFASAHGAHDCNYEPTTNGEVLFEWSDDTTMVQNGSGAAISIDIRDENGLQTHRISVQNIMVGGNTLVTPELNGSVSEISADLSVDERSGAAFYTVRVSLPRTELKRLKGLTLAPGMPVEAFFSTGSRSMLSYLVKPLADQIQRAFREE